MPQEKPQNTRKRGRPAIPPSDKKKTVTLRLTPDLVQRLDASGNAWRKQVEHWLTAMYP